MYMTIVTKPKEIIMMKTNVPIMKDQFGTTFLL